METIKIKRRIFSSTLKIRELEKYINKDVEITITPFTNNRINEELLLSENVLSKEWNNEDEDMAWEHLQKGQ